MKLYDKILSNKWYLLAAFAILLLVVIFFGAQLKAIVIVAILAFFGAFGQIYKRTIKVPSAVEFVTFGTVIVAVAYGPVAGALFALAIGFAAEIISGGIDAFVVVYLPVKVLAGVAAGLVAIGNIALLGLLISIFINVLSQPIYLLQPDTEVRTKAIVFLVANISFNFLLFKLLGEIVLNIAL